MRRERWSLQKRYVLEHVLAPPGIYIVTTEAPLIATVLNRDGAQQRFGGNRGCWPVRIGSLGNVRKRGRGKEPKPKWRDTITPLFDRNPFVETGLERRLWLPGEVSADPVVAAVKVRLALEAERDGIPQQLLHGFLDLGPDFSLDGLCESIVEVAHGLGMVAWSDEVLGQRLDRALLEAAADGLELDSPTFERLVFAMVDADRHKLRLRRNDSPWASCISERIER